MKQQTYSVTLAGGYESKLPQKTENAGRAENLGIDRTSGGWSTRVGYEPFEISPTSWFPFDHSGPIYSLHTRQGLAGGARQSIMYESDGELHLVFEAGGQTRLESIASNRHIPTPTESGSWFTDTNYGTIVTNGVDRPLLVRPWPLPAFGDTGTALLQAVRPFGFDGLPTPPEPGQVRPMPPVIGPTTAGGNGASTLWCPSQGGAVPDGGRWGLGFPNNAGDDGDKSAIFGWAVSFVSDTGSEGPTSTLGTTSWALESGAKGFRHAVPVHIPTGPKGTVARKIYRTSNYSDDYVNPGDTTLYFLDVIRNNCENLWIDAIRTSNLGQPAPLIATGPLPAPRARFSALFNGCLFLDGGVDDANTLYYSSPGLIEQFGAANYIELSAENGAITALWNNYNTLLVFRERGIDVVQGDFASGFQATTLVSNVTCKAPHSIQSVPGLGVVFLATDGVYALVGGLTGGAINEVINLTTVQDDFIQTITPDCHAKAVSCYSDKEREYHLYVPTGGQDRPDTGLVLHIDRLQAEGTSPWSIRKGFPVGAVTTLYDGTIVFGHNTGNEAADPLSERGLFVISGRRAAGVTFIPGPQQPVLSYNAPPTSVYRSAWTAFGDAQVQKQVSYVTVWVMTTGKPQVTMRHYKDHSLEPVIEQSYHAQSPDSKPQPVLDEAILGQTNYRNDRLVPLRFSVAHMSAAWFCFELETTEDLVLVGYEYEYTSKGTRVVAGVRA